MNSIRKCSKNKKDNTNIKPIIGIIGGCGVLATIDIEKEIIQAAQRLMAPLTDQDYPNILVYQYSQFHDRNDAICFNCSSPYNQYIKCANDLISIGANVLVFACNTAHTYIEFLKKKIRAPITDMIQEVVKKTVSEFPKASRIGLLSTIATDQEMLYQKAFAPYKISIITPNASIKKQVMQAIYLIKSGINKTSLNINHRKSELIKRHPYKKILVKNDIPDPCKLINDAIQYLLEKKGCSHVILGCTELPLIMENIRTNGNEIMLINPNKIVAEAVIRFYMTTSK